jgi:hypothetical protein
MSYDSPLKISVVILWVVVVRLIQHSATGCQDACAVAVQDLANKTISTVSDSTTLAFRSDPQLAGQVFVVTPKSGDLLPRSFAKRLRRAAVPVTKHGDQKENRAPCGVPLLV